MHGETLNYTISLWTAKLRQPRYIGPYAIGSCLETMRTALTGLVRDASYSMNIMAYNNNTRLKSRRIWFCECDHKSHQSAN